MPPSFYVANSPQIGNGAQSPQTGISFDGQRQDVTVDDILRWTGGERRITTVAQRRFRFAFLLIVPAGATPSAVGDHAA